MKLLQSVFLLIVFLCCAGGLFAQPVPEAGVSAEITSSGKGPFLLKVTYDIPEGFYQTKQPEFLSFSVSSPSGITTGTIMYPDGEIKNGSVTYEDSVTLVSPLVLPAGLEGPVVLEIQADYQLCDETGLCFRPASKTISLEWDPEGSGEGASAAVVPQNSADAAGPDPSIAEAFGTGGAETRLSEDQPNTPADSGLALTILQFIIFAFLGGLILNIMPCVLPVLSLKIFTFVKNNAENRKSALADAFFYSAGIIVSFLTLGIILAAVKLSGGYLGWGFQLQNPVFVTLLTGAVFFFALSMFDVFTFSMPSVPGSPAAPSKGKGFTTSFLTGVFAVILATPCTAPFIGTALAFALSMPVWVMISGMLVMGLGLALPFLLLGMFPFVARIIPKPGRWMNIFKNVMGFLLILTVIWLLSVMQLQISDGSLIFVLVYLFSLAVTAWLLGLSPSAKSRRAKRVLVVLALVLLAAFTFTISAVVAADEGPAQSDADLKSPAKGVVVEELTKSRLFSYLDRRQPVFVNITAEWCWKCKTDKASILYTEPFLDAMRRHNIAWLEGDLTLADAEIESFMINWNKAAVPAYALYVPDRPEPIVFPDEINRAGFLEVFEQNLQ